MIEAEYAKLFPSHTGMTAKPLCMAWFVADTEAISLFQCADPSPVRHFKTIVNILKGRQKWQKQNDVSCARSK